MQKKSSGRRESINLENWLEEKALQRDPHAFDDPNWRYKKLWFELILQMEVCLLTFGELFQIIYEFGFFLHNLPFESF